MPTTVSNKTITSLTGCAIIEDGDLYVIQTPSNFTLSPGIVQTILNTRNDIGEEVVESTFINENKPTIALTFPGLTPELFAIRSGRKLADAATKVVYVSRTFKITESNKVYAGASAGQEGEGMTADQPESLASVLGGNANVQSTALSRVDEGSFVPGTPDTFYQGANGGYGFSDNLVGCTVKYLFPLSLSNVVELGEDKFLTYQLRLSFVLKDGSKGYLDFPSAEVDLAAGDITLDNPEITFRAIFEGGCKPYELVFTDQVTSC